MRLVNGNGVKFLEGSGAEYLAGWHADRATLATAHELGLQYSSDVLTGAARAGDLTKVMWLHTEQHCEVDHQRVCDHAAIGGSTAVLAWLKQLGVALADEACIAAARHHQMPVLQYLHAEGCHMSQKVCYWAAHEGDLVMLKWAYEHGCTLIDENDDICEAAASSHNVDLMAWLIQQPGVELTAFAMCAAAEIGDIAMCEFLHANQCPWDEECCLSAAHTRLLRHGELDMLRWFREHGCPWDTDELAHQAAECDSVALMEYLQQQGVVFNAEQLSELLNAAGARGNLTAAKWLRGQGAEWPAVLSDIMFKWYGDTLAWARAEGCTSPLD